MNTNRFCKVLLPILSLFFLITSCTNKKGKFIQLNPEETNVHFTNTITENDSINIFDFANVYNGGGVGVGDFNNDGLQDLYFTGNLVSNKMYLNKGGFKFEDITQTAGTAGNGEWCRGVSVVDINNDGKMDLYVSATAKPNPLDRKNILFVNQGVDKNNIPIFKNLAQEYGLADTCQSTMSYFFDYDNDGDLDVYIGVNHIIKDEYANKFKPRNLDGEHPSTGKLLQNNWSDSLKHAVFTDVSRKSGILIEGYTHAANIFDADNDGWMDILVTNDYISNNVLYINNHDGTFTDHVKDYFKHTAANSMGSDAVDINNDGLTDVIEVDMAPQDNLRKKMMQNPNNYSMYQNSDLFGYQYQYPRNMLQVNQGPSLGQQDSILHPIFSETGFLSGIAETDWSWTPLVADYDNDGFKDILFTNGFPKDITDHDFITFRQQAFSLTTEKDMLKEIPEVKIHNYIYKNNGDLRFTDKTTDWGMQLPSFSNGAAYVDLDNDGDLDIVINDINEPALIFENNITEKEKDSYLQIRFQGSDNNINGLGANVIVYQKNNNQNLLNNPYRGYISSVSPIMHFGLGKNPIIDSVEVFWPGNLKQIIKNVTPNQTLTLSIKNATYHQKAPSQAFATNSWFTNITKQAGVTYMHEQKDFIDFNIQKLLPHKFSEYAPSLAVGDIDKNGLDDIVIGASVYKFGQLLLQQKNGSFLQKQINPSGNMYNKLSVDEGVLLFDADGDGDLDLYVASGGYGWERNLPMYQDQFFINDGKGNFQQDTLALPKNVTSKFCVRAADYDKDGDLDLFVSGRVDPWNYPLPVSSFIFRNDSKKDKIVFTDVTNTVAKDLINIGLTCDALFTDFNNDGWPDLILAGEWMPITFLVNEKGVYKNITSSSSINNEVGWWNSLAAGDFDNDGDIDYVVGNLGLNSFYRASDKYPVSIYAKDFDNNNSLDAFPSLYLPASLQNPVMKEFPAQTRDDVVKQMISMRTKFQNYKTFANATMDQLFTKEQLKGALILKSNNFKSSFIRNEGGGKFSITALPLAAQLSTLNGMVIDDFDADGNLDIAINGNDYGTEVAVGRNDALNGLVLKGDGKGDFIPLSILQSGIYLPGNGKALVKLTNANGDYLMAASQNRGPLDLLKLKRKNTAIDLSADEVAATITLKNGKTQRQEFYFGSSFLSQSARKIMIAENIASVKIFSNNGKERTIKY